MKTLCFVLMIVLATGCAKKVEWNDFSSFYCCVSYPSKESIVFNKFSDGIHVDSNGTMEMLQLDNGVYLFKGYAIKDPRHMSPFLFCDMAPGVIRGTIEYKYIYPMSISHDLTSLDYFVIPLESVIRGTVIKTDNDIIVYNIQYYKLIDSIFVHSMDVEGSFEFNEITPIPQDMDISEWTIQKGTTILILPPHKYKTIKDLQELTEKK